MGNAKMLDVQSFWSEIIEENCFWDDRFRHIDTIKEQLLRLSCKWTDYFACDILNFFSYFNQYFLVEDIIEMDFYFKQTGISWIGLDREGEIREFCRVPDKFRGQAKLTFDGRNMALYWHLGNC